MEEEAKLVQLEKGGEDSTPEEREAAASQLMLGTTGMLGMLFVLPNDFMQMRLLRLIAGPGQNRQEGFGTSHSCYPGMVQQAFQEQNRGSRGVAAKWNLGVLLIKTK